MSNTELTSKIRELRELEALIAEAQAEAEAIKDALKAHMGDLEELKAGEYRITWKAALPDVAQAFTKQTTTRRFVVA